MDSYPDALIWTVLIVASGFGLWAEKTVWGAKVSGAMVTLLTTFLLSNINILPSTSSVYGTVWSTWVPLAIPLLLLQANLAKILKEAGPTLIAFGLGAVGTLVGTVIACHLLPLGADGWKLAGIFGATYIGGSINFAGVAEILEFRQGPLLAAAIAADNLMMTLYFMILFTLPSITFLRKWYPDPPEIRVAGADEGKDGYQKLFSKDRVVKSILGLIFSIVVCWTGFQLADWFELNSSAILFITLLTVSAATAFPSAFGKLKGAEKIGIGLMQVFFAVIGASANINAILQSGPILLYFAGMILSIHLIVLLVLGKVFGLALEELVIASNANMGGPTTAAAMAASREWESLITPAILCGTLGYSIATFLGTALAYWIKG